MTFLIIVLFAIPGIILGKKIFNYFFNPLTVYTIIWFVMTFLFSLKLIQYEDLNLETWLYIIGAYFSLIIGSLTFYEGNKKWYKSSLNNSALKRFVLLDDNGKMIKLFIVVFSFLLLALAIQHWLVLIDMYGSIAGVLLNAGEIYRFGVEGKLRGIPPYTEVFGYIALFYAAILSGKRNKFTPLIILPFIGLFLKAIASTGRAGLLLGIVMFISTYFVTKYFFQSHQKNVRPNHKNTVILVLLAAIFFIGTSVYMRAFRNTVESFSGQSRALAGFEDNLIISPSIYLYMTAHIAVFNKYLEMGGEKSAPAQYTFQPIYNILANFNIVDKTQFYHNGYFVPTWTNTGTYLREMYADYGIFGIFLVPYILGFFVTFFWYKFFNSGNPIFLIFLNQIFAIIFFSFFLSPTRFGIWLFTMIILIALLPFQESMIKLKLSNRN